ncbi:MAG: S9 family peptidase [Chloroflexia bacterium]|nr:S9 family peptidase [Chloroflexia bacterium]
MAIIAPPLTRRGDVTETLHGVEITDHYRWLEDGADPETQAWTDAQNSRTEKLLGGLAGRVRLEHRLSELLSVGTVAGGGMRDNRFFYLKREGGQNQPILYVRTSLHGEERALVDPNSLSAEGLTALDWYEASTDGAFVAYGCSDNGDEWSTLRIVDSDTGATLAEAIPRTRYSSVAWLPDNSGFFYTRYPDPGSVPPGEEEYNSHVFWHALGTEAFADTKIFGEGRSPQDTYDLRISPNGHWLVIIAHDGWARSDCYLRDLRNAGKPIVTIAEGIDALFDTPHFAGDALLIRTNWEAPNYRIMRINPSEPDPSYWEVAVTERPNRAIENFSVTLAGIVTIDVEAAISRLCVHSDNWGNQHDLRLPGLGTVTGIDGDEAHQWIVVGYTSFESAHELFMFDVFNGERFPLAPVPPVAGFDPDAIEVHQVHYPSRDGTRISMFIVHQRGIRLDGDNPTLLTGYGGFNISEGPEYRAALPAWLERGGVFALPNLRGGAEYGETWHKAGMLGNKQNVFDDFICAAEWLIAGGYTRPERLGIAGGSNGGLLVGAALTQRPELFGAVYCAVPLLDMLRYHHFSIAKLWVPEYGSAEDPEAFRWLHAYSPYHRVIEGTAYPATLIATGEQDSRVEPLHARKMVALLQHATCAGEERPILLRSESLAGHGAGKPLSKRVAEAADQWGFLGWRLGVDWEE